MSKMQEAFEQWIMLQPSHKTERLVAFEAGYQAAIADVKAGGPVAFDTESGLCYKQTCSRELQTPLYKLPEDV